MKHFLVTRFNVRHDGWATTRDGAPILTEEWLEHRLDLFTKLCLPSVANQTNPNFQWVLFFDEKTPDSYKTVIEKMSKTFDFMLPVYISDYPALVPCLQEVISRSVTSADKLIVTSRLDNDDVIHKEFIDVVQRSALKSDTIIDLRKGLQMKITGKLTEFRNLYNCFNPFLSVVENLENPQTVMARQHLEWDNFGEVVVYDEEPMWIETVHAHNKLNQPRYSEPLKWRVKLREFGIDEEFTQAVLPHIVKHNLLLRIRKAQGSLRRTSGFKTLHNLYTRFTKELRPKT